MMDAADGDDDEWVQDELDDRDDFAASHHDQHDQGGDAIDSEQGERVTAAVAAAATALDCANVGPVQQQQQSLAQPPSILSRIALQPHKAGMDGVDCDQVNRIIYEVSKGSRFFKREQRQDEQITRKIERMLHALDQFNRRSPGELTAMQRQVDAHVSQLEAERDLTRIIVHIDMDAFFANVELKDNPELRGKPMAVGSLAMLSTASYEARKFGVRSAMPGYIAKRLCPELIIVPPHFDKYTRESEAVRKVLARYDPHFALASLDEAYLDITSALAARPDCTTGELVQEIRASIFAETQLTASAGIAANKMLAKICSDKNKPNGQFVLINDRAAIMTFVENLPVRKIPGIGKVTERLLASVDVTTVGHIREKRVVLSALFLKVSFDHLMRASLGMGSVEVDSEWVRKSVGCERTFASCSSWQDLSNKCTELADKLAQDLESEKLQGKVLTLKLKTVDFDVRTRAVTLPKYTFRLAEILQHAHQLLKDEMPVTLRLMGLRMSHLASRVSTEGSIMRFLQSAQQVASDSDPRQHSIDSSEPTEASSCPVCGRPLGVVTNRALNQHIDLCLNKRVLQPISTTVPLPTKSPHKRPADTSAPESSPSPSNKRPATGGGTGATASKSLLNFFKRTTPS